MSAETEEEAIEKALEVGTLDDIESWDMLMQFNKGNICYCPHPWGAEAVCEDDEWDTA